MRRWVEWSNDTEILPLRPFCQGYIIATRGYDFREGQGNSLKAPLRIHDGIDIVLKCDLLRWMFEGQSR
jgi:hypothetical protein